tara:strand:+ start:213 stop:350 length:138 start_codon:yes stop_codon:yes gene_type:complete
MKGLDPINEKDGHRTVGSDHTGYAKRSRSGGLGEWDTPEVGINII